MRSVGLILMVALAGCGGRDRGDGWGGPNFPAYDLAAPSQDGGGFVSGDGGASALGSGRGQPAATTPLRVQANAAIAIPPGQVGFTVTADGVGGYRVAWVDTAGANRRYHGSIFDDGTFSQISSVGMQYAIANGGRLDFESAPGAGTSGYVDFVSSVDPIVVDGLNGNGGSPIFYVDTSGITREVATPATFTSP